MNVIRRRLSERYRRASDNCKINGSLNNNNNDDADNYNDVHAARDAHFIHFISRVPSQNDKEYVRWFAARMCKNATMRLGRDAFCEKEQLSSVRFVSDT
jgi:hypothetical protein